jgi:hypothetical protein
VYNSLIGRPPPPGEVHPSRQQHSKHCDRCTNTHGPSPEPSMNVAGRIWQYLPLEIVIHSSNAQRDSFEPLSRKGKSETRIRNYYISLLRQVSMYDSLVRLCEHCHPFLPSPSHARFDHGLLFQTGNGRVRGIEWVTGLPIAPSRRNTRAP